MTADIVDFSRNARATRLARWRKIHTEAEHLIPAAAKDGEGDEMAAAKRVRELAQGEIKKLRRWE